MSGAGEDESEPVSRAVAIVREFNLPALIAGPAGKAISRLIGAAADIPAAAIENISSRIRDDARSRSLVTESIARKAAEVAASDPELVQRSLHRWLGDNARKQVNREKIAEAAAEEIAGIPEADLGGSEEPPADWMNHFSRFAEDASSDDVQRTWGRVLAGEIRQPGSFSLRTLRFISELDQPTAAIFNEYAPLVIGGDFLPGASGEGNDQLIVRVRLEEAGLIVGASSPFTRTFSAQSSPVGWQEDGYTLVIELTGPDLKFMVGGVLLTGIGKEMLKLVPRSQPVRMLENLASAIDKAQVAKLELTGPSVAKVLHPE